VIGQGVPHEFFPEQEDTFPGIEDLTWEILYGKYLIKSISKD
jgi:hypothetical protein